MLTRPPLADDKIIHLLKSQFDVDFDTLEFLPLGADRHTAVYKASTSGGKEYFLKLRSGNFEETAVTIPKFLKDNGVEEVIAPIPSTNGELHAPLENFHVILYPYIHGQDATHQKLSQQQWVGFGKALRKVHDTELPGHIEGNLKSETFSPKWRSALKKIMQEDIHKKYQDSVSAHLTEFLHDKRGEVLSLIERAEKLAVELKEKSLKFVLCHSDIHAANILVSKSGELYIIDWDNPILAPKERDLMYIGAGICGVWNTEEEEKMFYDGYGQTDIDRVAIAYYRCERIVEDISVFCDEILFSDESTEDRERDLKFLMGNFESNGVLQMASETENFLSN